MFKNVITISLLIIFAFSSFNIAQKRNKRHRSDWDDFHDFAWMKFDSHSSPIIELNYGSPKIKHEDFKGNFAKTSSLEFKIGYSSTYEFYEDYLIEREDNFLFANKISSSIGSETPGLNEFDNEIWQFGIGRLEGTGYNLYDISFIPYTQGSLVWSRLKKLDQPQAPFVSDSSDITLLDQYHEAIRFGTENEAGIKFNVASLVDVHAGFEFGTVYPKYLVWKQLGSFAIEVAGLALLDDFIEEITDSSPAAGPVMNAILKGAFSYAFYTLKKDRMNWPFPSESPLTYETFKFGITLTF